MTKSEYNKSVIENFILFFTRETIGQPNSDAIKLYESLYNYIKEDPVDGIDGDPEGANIVFDTEDNFYFACVWSKDDILHHAKDLKIELSDHECNEVRDLLVDSHDACIGINWDVIGEAIRQIKHN